MKPKLIASQFPSPRISGQKPGGFQRATVAYQSRHIRLSAVGEGVSGRRLAGKRNVVVDFLHVIASV